MSLKPNVDMASLSRGRTYPTAKLQMSLTTCCRTGDARQKKRRLAGRGKDAEHREDGVVNRRNHSAGGRVLLVAEVVGGHSIGGLYAVGESAGQIVRTVPAQFTAAQLASLLTSATPANVRSATALSGLDRVTTDRPVVSHLT